MTKRLLDLSGAAVLLVALLPVWVLIAAAVKLTSRGPVFHRAVRVGYLGCPFVLFKFRTMVVAGDEDRAPLTTVADPRITSVGRFLRRWKLDETPQLINVIRGEMALVGPRPEDPRYVARYTPEQRRVLSVRPGLTGPAALAFREEERLLDPVETERHYVEEILPAKLSIDLEYVDRHSVRSDVLLLLRTPRALLSGRGDITTSTNSSSTSERSRSRKTPGIDEPPAS